MRRDHRSRADCVLGSDLRCGDRPGAIKETRSCPPTTMSSIPTPPNGSESLFALESSPPETLTNAPSSKSKRATSKGTRNATSSPGLADGPERSGSQAGPTTNPPGQDRHRVSRFRALDSAKAMPTNDTCGPLFTASSPSAALQSALASRLRARMDVNGSPEYALTWKDWDMPAGVPICALRASARRTSGSGFTGWPTACAGDATKGVESLETSRARGAGNLNLPSTAALALKRERERGHRVGQRPAAGTGRTRRA